MAKRKQKPKTTSRARKRSPRKKGPKPVEATVHRDKRTNLPTADAHEFVTPEVESAKQLRYPRRPELDPQLVWRGKDEQDGEDLVVDAPPIYIQEKVDPRVLIENLRQTAKAGEQEPELTLFDDFDGLPELDIVDFYQHEANWSNRMVLGDSLQVMSSLAEREALRGQVQMVYIDPPYGVRFNSNWQTTIRRRDVKDGKVEDIAREVEQIKAFRDTWELGIHSYLSYIRDRVLAAHDLLRESGSLFIQMSDENVHLVRAVLDEVFGSSNYVATINYTKTSSQTARYLAVSTDYILWYAKDITALKYRPLFLSKSLGGPGAGMYQFVQLADGSRRRITKSELSGESSLPPGARPYRLGDATSQRQGRESGPGSAMHFPVHLDGQDYYPPKTRGWTTTAQGMRRLAAASRLSAQGNRLSYIRYLDDFASFDLDNDWSDTAGASDRVFVVQTNPLVIQRCVVMTTDPGDLVLDPTCGSGTTAFVAESWGRRWITVDTSRVALALARQRIMGARFPYYLLADSKAGREKESELTGSVLPDASVTNDVRHGFVYERRQHITLKSIANNPDIKEGMSRKEVDEAIGRHADFELLYDKPYEDKSKIRVAGPFTVESLSPHRSLAFSHPHDPSDEPQTERRAAEEPTTEQFERSILNNLEKAGVQNGRRNERITFSLIEPYAAAHIQAVGVRDYPEEGTPARVGISIGPQYGTIGPSFIKDAAREALKAGDLDLLCILGFAFDPQALDAKGDVSPSIEGFADVAAERKLGKLPVLLVRMNADLVMGEELKKTGSGNLFTVFGEPDIDITTVEGGELVVKLRGVDVYDPTTGEVRSNDTGQIALWMIDTDYNGESFFVRHCYFTGGHDPYKRLKTALKAEIDEDAWASLYQTESRPFPRPETGKIAVKVINDYGDEVLKVYDVGVLD